MKQHRTLAIGAAARAASISVKMVRHYETTGLLPAAQRGTGGTRLFNEQDVHTLRFIARARALGFPLRTVRELLSLWQHPARNAHISSANSLHCSTGTRGPSVTR